MVESNYKVLGINAMVGVLPQKVEKTQDKISRLELSNSPRSSQ
jgi:hypothetical protein